MEKLQNLKVTKGLSSVVCALVLFSSNALASQENGVGNTNIVKESISSRSASNTKALEELTKLLELLKANSSGFFAPLTQNLNGVIDTIVGALKTAASGGKIDFDFETIGTRIQLAIKTVKNISQAVQKDTNTTLYYKEEKVLVKYGFGITGVILDIANPFTKGDTLSADESKLERILKEAQNGANMSDESIANSNVKNELETLLRDCRNIVITRWTYLQDRAEFTDLKEQIATATAKRVDPVLRYGELKSEMATLQAKKDAVDKILKEIGYANIPSTIFDRMELGVALLQARTLQFGVLKDKTTEVKNALNSEIERLTKIRYNLSTSLADIMKAKEDLKLAIKKATNATSTNSPLATKSSKDMLIRELHIARFLKFRKTAKKGWDVNAKLDKIVFKLSIISINPNASQAEVDGAIKSVKIAMNEAISAPDVW